MSEKTKVALPATDRPPPSAPGPVPATSPVWAWTSSPWISLAIAAGVPALLFFVLPPLTRSGLWDPYELNVADLSRRVALNLYGASHLSLSNADNSLPHLNDLGRPQLPFLSVALGFRLFGLHEWAGRLPLALWGWVGAIATYAFVARLFDRRTGVYAVIALSTMPLYFVQARSILGDICAMAALAMAFGGLAVGAFDREAVSVAPDGGADLRPTSLRSRAPWLAMAAVGLAVGFESRGGLLGLAVPLLGVGLAWVASRITRGPRAHDRVGDIVGGASLVFGLGAAAMTLRAVALSSKDLDPWLGALVRIPGKYPTFDYYVAAIGHALAPWSAFIPFAFGRMLLTPVIPHASRAALERESLGRLAVLVGAAVAFVAHAYLVATTDLLAFSGPALCAIACAVALRDFERGAPASVAIGLGTLLLAAVLHHDFHELPEKAYEAFGIASATFPEGFKNTALGLWWVVLGGFALCAFLTWVERDAARTPFEPSNYARVLKALRELYDGNLALTYFALVAGFSIAGLLVFAGVRTHAGWLPQMSSTVRDLLLNAWWMVAFVPLGAIFGLMFACDVWLWAFGRSRPASSASLTRGFEPFEELLAKLRPETPGAELASDVWWVGIGVVAPLMLLATPLVAYVAATSLGLRPLVAIFIAIPSGIAVFLVLGFIGDLLRHRAPAFALGGLIVGLVLCVSYYPALANQLSPKEVFESYGKLCQGAPLALLGVGGRTSAYYAGGQPQVVNDAVGAYQWLAAGVGQRRCIALKAEELPKLNQLWREHNEGTERTNLPVVDARSSQILLAASSLGPDEKNQNPLMSVVLSAPPRPAHPIHANMEDKLEVVGFDLLDERGRQVDVVSPGRAYQFKTYYRVLAPVTTEWEAFIHIDGYHRRHNGDHKPMDGKYPMSLWLPGDLLVDDHEFKLEPNFTPGTYTIYFGLFAGDTRLKVTSGPNDGDNRINGGALRVQ